MHIIILRDELLKACQNVIGAVERRNTLNILSNILLAVEEDSAYLKTTATDLELELKSGGAIKTIITPGKITVSARKLVDICRSLPKGAEVELKLEDKQLLIRSEKRVFNLITLPATEYPDIEELSGEKIEFQLRQSELKTAVSRTAFAIPQQDVRYFLNGLLFELESGKLNFVATDGHRLAFAEMQLKNVKVDEKKQIIVPKKTISELATLLSGEDRDIKIIFSKNHLVVESGDFKMTSKLIDGKYPNYNRVIPKNCNRAISVNTEGFKISLNCVSVLANEAFRGIRLFLADNQIKMSANNTQQEEADESIEVDYQGPDIEMAFNIDYLIDVCNNVTSDKMVINFADLNSPVMIEEEVGGIRYIYVVMPMRL
jgi:DNA polymerase-3 subunit beta